MTKSEGGSFRSKQTGPFPQEIKETLWDVRESMLTYRLARKGKFEQDLATVARHLPAKSEHLQRSVTISHLHQTIDPHAKENLHHGE